MRNIITLLSFFALSINIIFAQAINEEKQEHKLNRIKWFEDMHKTSGLINWKVIDNETRSAKFHLKQSEIIQKINKGENLNSDEELLAGGRLTAKWIERGSNNISGRIRYADIDFKNNKIYAASDGGNIWRSDFSNIKWTCLNNKFNFEPIRCLKIFPSNNSSRIFVVKNGPSTCYYSDNDGLIWNETKGLDDLKSNGQIKRTIITDDNNVYLMAEVWNNDSWNYSLNIYKSSDKGENFTLLFSRPNTRARKADMWAAKYNADKIILTVQDSIFNLSFDGDLDFYSKIPIDDYGNYSDYILRGNKTTSNNLYFGTRISDPETPGFSAVRFIHYNLDTKKIDNTGIIHDFGFFEDNSWDVYYRDQFMVCGGVNAYYSFDNGRNWTEINDWAEYYGNEKTKLHADIPAVIFLTDQVNGIDYQLICTDGGLYISDNYVETVNNISLSSLNTSQYYSTYTHRDNYDIIMAGAQDQGYQLSLPEGEGLLDFKQLISGDYGHLVSSNGGDILYGDYPGFLITYTNITKENRISSRWDFEGDNWLWLPPIVAHPNNPNKAYIMSGGVDTTTNIWEIDYLSSIYTKVTMIPFNFRTVNNWEKVSYLAISKNNSNRWYAVTTEGVFFSSLNAGKDWVKSEGFDGPNSHYFYGSKLVIDPNDDNVCYIAGSGYENSPVWVTKDGGNTFEQIGNGLPNTLIFDMVITNDGQYIFAATQVGPYMYFKNENKWYDISGLTAPDQSYWSVEYLPEINTIRYSTYGRGIWDLKITSINPVSSVEEAAIEPVLSVNPNPIIEKAEINFNIEKAGYGELKIYDIEGNIADILFQGDFNLGKYNFKIEKNKFKLNLNQIYFVVLTCNDKAYYSKILFE